VQVRSYVFAISSCETRQSDMPSRSYKYVSTGQSSARHRLVLLYDSGTDVVLIESL
jgi:hypothetical protein